MTVQSILPPNNRTDLEEALDRAIGRRINSIPVPIRDMDDASAIPVAALPYLAWGRAAGLWDDDWPEWLRRRVAERSIHLRRIGGTLPAIEGWLEFLGAEVVDAVIPPAGCFATGGQTVEQRQEFLGRFAELRITLRRSPGPGDTGTVYAATNGAGDPGGFVGANFALISTASDRYGRKATIVDGGEEVEVSWSLAAGVNASGVATEVERVVIPGDARPSEPFAGEFFAGTASGPVAEPHKTTSRIFAIGPDRSPQSGFRYALIEETATPLDVLSVTPERVSQASETAARPAMAGEYVGSFAYQNTAAERYFDRYRIFDADRVPVRQTASYGTFVGYSRAKLTPFRAEIRVAYPGDEPETSARVDGFVGGFPMPTSGRLGRVADAVRAGKSWRDKTFFTIETKRLRTLADGIPLDGSFRFGGLIEIARGSS